MAAFGAADLARHFFRVVAIATREELPKQFSTPSVSASARVSQSAKNANCAAADLSRGGSSPNTEQAARLEVVLSRCKRGCHGLSAEHYPQRGRHRAGSEAGAWPVADSRRVDRAIVVRALASKTDAAKPEVPGTENGLGRLIERFREGGLDDIIKSWIGTGANKPVTPNQLQHALGQDTVEGLARETGMPRDDLLSQLSRLLPEVVDKLTPQGRLPNDEDLIAGPRESGERSDRRPA
jgi:uncharacterized protein YidB (DUF937 family)